MTVGRLEHANFSVSDPQKTADMLIDLFGWHIRWEGPSISDGYSIHVGSGTDYLALYRQGQDMKASTQDSYRTIGAMNHIGVVVDDIDAVETKVRAMGCQMGDHHDYEPGRRFYFHDHDGIEFEVVEYN